jgi:hypothetical protein
MCFMKLLIFSEVCAFNVHGISVHTFNTTIYGKKNYRNSFTYDSNDNKLKKIIQQKQIVNYLTSV